MLLTWESGRRTSTKLPIHIWTIHGGVRSRVRFSDSVFLNLKGIIFGVEVDILKRKKKIEQKQLIGTT